MKRERLNKLATELGNSIFDNDPTLHPGNLTLETVRTYAEGAGFDDLTQRELDQLVSVTFDACKITHGPTKPGF